MTFDHLEKFDKFIEPGPIARKVLDSFQGRAMGLHKLERVDDLCVWCNVAKLKTKRHRWCSPDCVNSGQIYARPQSPESKAIIFIHFQNCVCLECGVDHSEYIEKRITRRAKDYLEDAKKMNLPPEMAEKVSFFQVGYNTGDELHVDHKIPIHRGGRGIGFENIQVICAGCHKKKTADEARGLR